jgi:hypothetical protein
MELIAIFVFWLLMGFTAWIRVMIRTSAVAKRPRDYFMAIPCAVLGPITYFISRDCGL